MGRTHVLTEPLTITLVMNRTRGEGKQRTCHHGTGLVAGGGGEAQPGPGSNVVSLYFTGLI